MVIIALEMLRMNAMDDLKLCHMLLLLLLCKTGLIYVCICSVRCCLDRVSIRVLNGGDLSLLSL